MKKPVYYRLLIISIILALLVLGCNRTSARQVIVDPTGTPDNLPTLINTPTQTQPFSPDTLTYIFSEDDLLRWIVDASVSSDQFEIVEPDINLDNGICDFSGNISMNDPGLSAFNGKIMASFSIAIGESGEPLVDIQALTLNGFPMPGIFRDQVSLLLNNAILSLFREQLGGSKIQYLLIDDGYLTAWVGS